MKSSSSSDLLKFMLIPTKFRLSRHYPAGKLLYKTRKEATRGVAFFAEREGFEPPVPFSTPVFKTGVIDHSTISPKRSAERLLVKSGAKIRQLINN